MEGLIYINQNLHQSDFFNRLVKFITLLGDGAFIWIVFAVLMLCFKKTRKGALMMLISLAVGFILNDFVLKQIFSRPRPFAVNEDIANFITSIGLKFPSGFSFPSGHAFSSFNCALVIALCNKKLAYVSIPTAVVISLSRIFMCVHYPTDVLAGAIMGIVVALVVYFTFGKIEKLIASRKRKRIRLADDKNC